MQLGPELDALIGRLLDDYLSRNQAASVLQEALDQAGVGFVPV